jgi:hypothetical protein
LVGRGDEGNRLLEEALPRYRGKLGADDRDVLDITIRIAQKYSYDGRAAEAVRLLEPAYHQAAAKYGRAAGVTIGIMQDLSVHMQWAGRVADSARLLEEALPELRKRYGSANSAISPHVINLSEAYSRLDRPGDAVTMLEGTIADIPEAERLSYTNYDFLLRGLAIAHLKLGDTAQYRRVVKELEDWTRRRNPAGSLELAMGLAALGRDLNRDGMFADAERVLRESLAIREAKIPDGWQRFSSAAQLGGALLGQKRFAEAEPLLVAGYEGMKARQKDIPPGGKDNLSWAVWRLGHLFDLTGRPEKAAVVWAELPREVAPQPRPVTR